MTEIAKNKKKGGGGGTHLDTTNFMRQFRDSDSLELKKLSAAQFMEVWEHYDSDGEPKLFTTRCTRITDYFIFSRVKSF